MHSRIGKKIPKLILKSLLWIILGVLGIVVLLLIVLQFPGTQKYVTDKVTTYVSQKIKSKVTLGGISIAFPKDISLTDLYVEDLHQDTLLYAHSIQVNLNLWDLLSKKLELRDISISRLTAHVYREFPDTTFNYSFIPAAFSSPEKKEVVEDSTSDNAFQFSIKNVTLSAVNLSYQDTIGGIHTNARIGSLQTNFDVFDLNKKKIHVQSIELKGTNLLLVQHAPLKKDTTPSKPFDYNLGVDQIAFDKVNTTYRNLESQQDLRAAIGRLHLKSNELDIAKEHIYLSAIDLSESAILYTLNKHTSEPVEQKDSSSSSSNWTIALRELNLKNNSFAYENKNADTLTKGMDFNHLLFSSINIDCKNIMVAPEKITLSLRDLNLKEACGFTLKKFKTDLTFTPTRVKLDKLAIETSNSKIGNYIDVQFKSLASLKDSIGKMRTVIDLQKTTVSLRDIAFFQPTILANPNLNLDQNTTVRLNCKVNGLVDDLQIQELAIGTLTETEVELSGHLKNVTQSKLMYADVALKKFQTGKSDIDQIVPQQVIPKNIAIPASIKADGNFKGYLSKFDATLGLQTSIGNASTAIKMDIPAHSNDTTYTANVNVAHFDLGKLLKDTALLGTLTMHTKVEGQGLSPQTIHANLSTLVEEATFKKYTYKDLRIEGLIHKKSFDGKMSISDTNIAFVYSGLIDLDSTHSIYDFDFNLMGADLKALHLSDEAIRVSTLLQSNLKKENTENITGTAVLKNTVLLKDETKYWLDSILLTSSYQEKDADIKLTSDMLHGSLKGTISLGQLSASLKKYFKTYFDLQQKDTLQKLKPQQFKFEFAVTDPSILTEGLIPKLEKLTPFSMEGVYDSEAKDLAFKLDLPQVVYSKIVLDTLKVEVKSTAQSLTGAVKATEVSNPTVKLENINIGMSAQHNQFQFGVQTAKDDSTKILSIAGNLKSENKTFHLKLEPELVLNASNWKVDTSNYLVFSKTGLIANNLILKDSSQTIAINSTAKNEQSPLKIDLTAFKLETFSKLIENKEELARGTMDGNVILKQENNASVFTSDLTIKGLAFKSIPTGDIHLLASNTNNPKKFDVQFSLTGNENKIHADGYYSAETATPNLNMLVTINHLNLKTIEPYTFGQVTQMSGGINGKLSITGNTSAPEITGALNLNTCAFRPKFLDTYLHLEQETITLESKKFDSFTLIDSLNNEATLDGYVDVKDLKELPFDLRLKTSNFLALNTTEEDNPLYFGTIYLDSDISLKGTTNHPIIKAKIGLEKGTIITYVKPENAAGKNDSKGIVEFIDTLEIQKNIMTRKVNGEEMTATKGIDLKATISFDKDAELKMLVDRQAGDSLYIKGSGQLDFSLDEGGTMSLVGKYRINDGGYHLTINDLIKKNFSIAKGSSVTWSGDATDPYVDIDAIYKIKASPVDLVEGQLTGADQLERNKYRTLMTFLVYLKMNGFVSTPNISFDIQQPANERGALNGAINAKLSELRSDESQLNKQVFALLTLNRFIGEDPFESGGSGGVASASRASASRLLTQQLSNLSAKYVKGVDLNLGVNSYEDYSSGQQEGRTQLEVGISKTLLNDKVTVQVGGNIDIEGEKAKQNNASDVAGNISIEYKLTDDGRYKLKGYRQNEYENPIEGELIKTGFGIIYRRNYNKLKELFSKPKPKKKTTN
jgi:translocation and assembly module TamB